MGKRDVRMIPISKRLSVVLLTTVSGAMIAMLWFLEGKAYVSDSYSLAQAVTRRALPKDARLAVIMPLIADLLFFIPWGFLAFIIFDRPPLRRSRAYVATLLLALSFAALIHLWQSASPSPLTTTVDAAAYALGAMAGAALGHLRRQVRIRFEV